MGSLAGPKARREPAGEAKPDVCVISDGEAGAYCTVGLVVLGVGPDLQCFSGPTLWQWIHLEIKSPCWTIHAGRH